MGEVMEFTTLPSHQNVSYKINGIGFIFYVKTRGGAAVGLSKLPKGHCNYWVYIARIGRTWIASTDDEHVSGRLGSPPHIPTELNQNEYKKFWLLWNNNILKLGLSDDPQPIASIDDIKLDNIKYVTFSSIGNTIHWKLILPPNIPKPLPLKMDTGNMQWVAADEQLPDESFIGGYEDEFLYIIRAKHAGSLTPGKFVPSMSVGFIPWGGQAHHTSEFEVLCGYNCIWVQTKGCEIPLNAIEAGHSEGYNSEVLFVGRAKYNGHIIPGKVQPSHKVCYIPYDGREVAIDVYEILVRPHPTNNHIAGDYYRNAKLDYPPDEFSGDEME